eukprot:CAMPEP_0198110854 /NCGR_PEP_ID=MMETSP1442-20131203/2853_1 /TAXON_ID= /ORGANISM="Craspedostauros australis, Strain CCMP3328" /LENGTH=39 /DNA_ID= /DNA_START= /DNA_END= /DNA_ORIENTATION=
MTGRDGAASNGHDQEKAMRDREMEKRRTQHCFCKHASNA